MKIDDTWVYLSGKELWVGDKRIIRIQMVRERNIFKSKIAPLFMPIFI